ncbi:1-acylglycerol-3-phosphate O-acyltransferase [Chytridiales sp. JEL 0842]|nr:1-acylglycerol-3-phosphate O-acyltransferase [Chytridiales sp. JEL 0842]
MCKDIFNTFMPPVQKQSNIKRKQSNAATIRSSTYRQQRQKRPVSYASSEDSVSSSDTIKPTEKRRSSAASSKPMFPNLRRSVSGKRVPTPQALTQQFTKSNSPTPLLPSPPKEEILHAPIPQHPLQFNKSRTTTLAQLLSNSPSPPPYNLSPSTPPPPFSPLRPLTFQVAATPIARSSTSSHTILFNQQHRCASPEHDSLSDLSENKSARELDLKLKINAPSYSLPALLPSVPLLSQNSIKDLTYTSFKDLPPLPPPTPPGPTLSPFRANTYHSTSHLQTHKTYERHKSFLSTSSASERSDSPDSTASPPSTPPPPPAVRVPTSSSVGRGFTHSSVYLQGANLERRRTFSVKKVDDVLKTPEEDEDVVEKRSVEKKKKKVGLLRNLMQAISGKKVDKYSSATESFGNHVETAPTAPLALAPMPTSQSSHFFTTSSQTSTPAPSLLSELPTSYTTTAWTPPPHTPSYHTESPSPLFARVMSTPPNRTPTPLQQERSYTPTASPPAASTPPPSASQQRILRRKAPNLNLSAAARELRDSLSTPPSRPNSSLSNASTVYSSQVNSGVVSVVPLGRGAGYRAPVKISSFVQDLQEEKQVQRSISAQSLGGPRSDSTLRSSPLQQSLASKQSKDSILTHLSYTSENTSTVSTLLNTPSMETLKTTTHTYFSSSPLSPLKQQKLQPVPLSTQSIFLPPPSSTEMKSSWMADQDMENLSLEDLMGRFKTAAASPPTITSKRTDEPSKEERVAAKAEQKKLLQLLRQPLDVVRSPTDTPLYYARTTLFILTMALSYSTAIAAGAALSIFGKQKMVNDLTAVVMGFLGRSLGIDFRVEGKEHLYSHRPCVFVCNHQSVLDLFMICQIFPYDCPKPLIMSKSEMVWIPLIGAYLYVGGHVFIDRENRKSAIQTMKYVAGELERQQAALFIFPEGTRTEQTVGGMLPFKKGAFHLAIEGQIPIVPIVVSTYGPVHHTKERLFRGGKVRIKVLPPISTKGMDMSQLQDLSDRTKSQMQETLTEISRPVAKL